MLPLQKTAGGCSRIELDISGQRTLQNGNHHILQDWQKGVIKKARVDSNNFQYPH